MGPHAWQQVIIGVVYQCVWAPYGLHHGYTGATVCTPMPLPVYWCPAALALAMLVSTHPHGGSSPRGIPFARGETTRSRPTPKRQNPRWGRTHGALLPRTDAAQGIQMSTTGACVLRRLACTWRAQAHARPRAQRGGGSAVYPARRGRPSIDATGIPPVVRNTCLIHSHMHMLIWNDHMV